MGITKVLFLDDEEDMLMNYEVLLEDEPYEILTTTEAEKAKWYLNEDDIGVFVSDYEMPEINGLEILEIAREVSPATIRMMATGHTESDIMVAAINEGNVYRYFVKPIDSDELLNGIKEGAEYYEELKTVEYWIGKHKHYSDASSSMEILETQLEEREAELEMILAENEVLSSSRRKLARPSYRPLCYSSKLKAVRYIKTGGGWQNSVWQSGEVWACPATSYPSSRWAVISRISV